MMKDKKSIFRDLTTNDLFIIILAFVFIVAIKIVLSMQFSSPFIMPDEVFYSDMAHNVLAGKLYTSFILQEGTTPPAYSVLLAPVFLFTQNVLTGYHLMLILNALMITSIIFPSYFILRKYCQRIIAVGGALIIATLPIINLFPFTLMSENLFFPLFVFSMWFLLESISNDDWRWDVLAGASAALLYVTRSTGIAMLGGFVLAFIFYLVVNRGSGMKSLAGKWKLIASFLIVLACWMAYSTYMIPGSGYSMGNPYNAQSDYTERLVNTATNNALLYTYSGALLYELDYLLISSYFIFPLFLIFFLVWQTKKMDKDIGVVFAYFVLTSVMLLVVTMTYMSYQNTEESLLMGRYIEPIIPGIFIFGFIGLDNLLKAGLKEEKKYVPITLASIAAILIIIFTVPHISFGIISDTSVYYLSQITDGNVTDIVLILILSLALLLSFMSVYNKKYLPLFFLFILAISLVTSVYTFQKEAWFSRMCFNEDIASLNGLNIMYDSNNVNRQAEFICWFWIGPNMTIGNAGNITYVTSLKNVDYVLSNDMALPYKNVDFIGVFCLYDIDNITMRENFPYVINANSNDINNVLLLKNFQRLGRASERWTMDSSSVTIGYPGKFGDMNITIEAGGYRPADDPARVNFTMNGHLLGTVLQESHNGTYVTYHYTVNSSMLNDYTQTLQINTNTYDPINYGVADNRDLGITIGNITIDR
jgi:hypothetical protein